MCIRDRSRKELQKIETLKNMIIVTVDKNTSMTSVTVTLQNPKVAAKMCIRDSHQPERDELACGQHGPPVRLVPGRG